MGIFRSVFLAAVLLCAGSALNADIHVVTNGNDSGAGSLRQVIDDADPGDTITFQLSGDATISISSQLSITKSLTIDGANSAGSGTHVTVQVTIPGVGGTNSRVFFIAANTVSISNMTIKGGDISVNGNTDAGFGGDIYHQSGTLNLSNSTVSGAKAYYIGGIMNFNGAILTINSSTISGNTAISNGGGIGNWGPLTITSSTISGNTATSNCGGIYNFGILTMISSTVSGNTATSYGGGIYNALTMTIISSTVSGNNASYGGGICNFLGGLSYLLNTVIINNTSGTGADIYNISFIDAYYCWYKEISGSINGNSNITTAYTAGSLGDLADNGGPTKTMAVNTGAPAIGKGTFAYDTANGTLDGFYFLAADGNYHQLIDYTNSTATEPTGKITTDQRGVTIFPTPTIGSYAPNYYMAKNPGNWSDTSIWFVNSSGGSIPDDYMYSASTPPTAANSDGIIINANVTVDSDVTIDQTTVNTGCTLTIASSKTLTVANGSSADLTVTGAIVNNGTFAPAAGSTVLYNGGAQTIAAASYRELQLSGPGTPVKTFADGTTSVGQQISISQPMTLTGSAANAVTVQVTDPGVTVSRVFYIDANDTVSISNMTIKGGDISANGNVDAGYGGGILVQSGTLNLSSSTVSGSKAWFGGGISLYNGTTSTINSSTISGNTATSSDAGGIGNFGSLTINSSTISGNSAPLGDGGGIYNSSNMKMISSTVSGNNATNGGGIYNMTNLTMISSTVSGNSATNGGGIYNFHWGLSFLLNTVIINNTVGTGADIYNISYIDAYYCWYKEIYGLINGNSNITTAYTPGDLGALADNGGPTQTMAVNTGAPAIGNGTFAYNTDGTWTGFYFLAADGNYHQLVNYATSTATEPAGKITTDQRGVSIVATPTIGSYYTPAPTYAVTYDGNGNTGGTVPVDASSPYNYNSTVTVLGNTGSLVKTGYSFASWNSAADGSGTNYAPAATFLMGAANVTLYAKWTALPTYTVTYDGNGNTGGSVPTDGNSYFNGATVTVLGNTGNLVKSEYNFAKWNTAADGSGTDYALAATFPMGSANVTLYAKWTIQTFTLTSSAGPNGSISLCATVAYGASKTFTITPATGYHVADVLVDAVSIGAIKTYTFTNVTANHTIYASFARDAGPYSISGTVSGDVQQGVTLILSGTGSFRITSGADGTFTFEGLSDGSYIVTPRLSGYTFNPSSRKITVSGENIVGCDFTATKNPGAYSISGKVSGAVQEDVLITLSGALSSTTLSDEDGSYSFTGLADGSYTVTPALSGYTFTPFSLDVTITGASKTDVNFIAAATIFGQILKLSFNSSHKESVKKIAGAYTQCSTDKFTVQTTIQLPEALDLTSIGEETGFTINLGLFSFSSALESAIKKKFNGVKGGSATFKIAGDDSIKAKTVTVEQVDIKWDKKKKLTVKIKGTPATNSNINVVDLSGNEDGATLGKISTFSLTFSNAGAGFDQALPMLAYIGKKKTTTVIKDKGKPSEKTFTLVDWSAKGKK